MAIEDIKNIPVVEASMSNATYVGAGGSMGPQGPQGETGPKGDPFTYEDFTQEQLEGLRGPQGPQGPKGDPFTYDDFTQEQLEGLRGPQGEPFTFADLTQAQIQVLKGPRGETGEQGPQGIQGTQGNDGITPTVSVSAIQGGHSVDFNYGVDDYRNTNFDVMDGQNGVDGNTPVITTSKSGTTTTIYADGVSIGTISDGAPGQDGSAGQNGNDGKSAYEVAVENGFQGNEAAWLASLVGQQGQPGQDGDDRVYVGSSAPTDPDVDVWIDTSGSTPNIANYYTKTEIDNKGYLTQHQSLSGYATETWVGQQGYLTQHQDISGKANSADLAAVATSGDYDDLLNKPSAYSLPTASTSTLGGVKVDGTTITIDNNGVISGSGGSSFPNDPSNDGSYMLVNTISSGSATQTWETTPSGGGASLPTNPVNDGSYILVNTMSSGASTQTWQSVAIGGSY